MKITVSGWPGAGSSTLTLLLAKNLNYKMLTGSEVFRHLGKKLKQNNTGQGRIEADELLEPEFGPIYDKYIDSVLMDEDRDNLIIESDLAGFRIGKADHLLNIFLTPDLEQRKKRLKVDGRHEDIELLEKRTESLRQLYRQIHEIDFTDIIEIKKQYHLVIDNSQMSIASELKIAYEYLNRVQALSIEKFNNLFMNAEKEEEQFWKGGKEEIKKELLDRNLVYGAEEIIAEIKKTFPEEIKNLPEAIRAIL